MIKTYEIGDTNANDHNGLFSLLLKHKMYTEYGVFKNVWKKDYPFGERSFLTVEYDDADEPIAVALLHDNEYYGW